MSNNNHGNGCLIGYPWGHFHPWYVQGEDMDKVAEFEWQCVLGNHQRVLFKC